MTTKIFNEGELLTAADVNNFLVNDDEALSEEATEMLASFEKLLTKIENIKTNSSHEALNPDRIYRHDMKDYSPMNNPSLREWTAIFHPNIEILYVVTTSNLTLNSTTVKLQDNKLKISEPTTFSVYFKIKE